MCPDCPSAPTLHHTLLDLYLGGTTARQQQGWVLSLRAVCACAVTDRAMLP